MTGSWRVLVAATALGCAASGGALLVFSTVTTRALRSLPAAQAMTVMQQLNDAAPRSAPFMLLLFGPGASAVLLLARAALHRHEPSAALVVAGSAVYLVGAVGLTVAFHVPRNQALAVLDPVGRASAWPSWPAWLDAWTAGNHVRVGSALAAAALLLAAVRR